jgi:hypothetical protein
VALRGELELKVYAAAVHHKRDASVEEELRHG